jgi:hypothetical protein
MTKAKGWTFDKKSDRKKTNHDRRKKSTNPSARKAVGKGSAPGDQRMVPSFKVHDVAIDAIKVVGERRAVDPEKVRTLVESIRAIGLRTPLTVRKVDGEIQLVAGLYRLAAAKALGRKAIPCVYSHGGQIIAEMWQIAENLHRAELPPLEESAQIAKWVKLWKSLKRISGQSSQEKTGPGRPHGGKSAAARELPVKGGTADAKRKNVERALKINAMDPAAKKAAAKAGFNKKGSKSKLLEIADEPTPEAQMAKVGKLKAGSRKKKPSTSGKASSGVELPIDVLEREWKDPKNKKLRLAWKQASPQDRRLFVTTVMKFTLKDA